MRTVPLFVSLLCPAAAWAQPSVPTIRAGSRVVTVTDGHHVKKNHWFVMPERVPDVYYVEVPLEPHTVTFTTDVASIDVPVTFGAQPEFVIRLDDGREARTQVRADFRNLLTSRRTGPPSGGAALIPFTLGDNDKIYVKGRINGGPVLDFQFDFGAGGSLVKKASVPKANLQFDGTIRLHNSDGANDVPSSSRNRLEIAGLAWDAVPFAVADNMTHREDALIGNGLFLDKVVEIDYGRMVIAVRDTLPALDAAWTRQDMVLDGGTVPFARGTLAVGGVRRDGWFMLDTGAYTSILNADGLSASAKLTGELRRLFGVPPPPLALSIAGRRFENPNFSGRRYDGDPSSLGLLGNDVLKRFDIVLDNRRGAVYLRPNGHMGDAFRNPEYYAVRAGAGAAGLFGAGLAVLGRRRRHARRAAKAA